MAVTHRLLNHNTLTTLYDSCDTVRKYQQYHASNLGAGNQRVIDGFPAPFFNQNNHFLAEKKRFFSCF